jgi:hypothetical protein
VRYELNILSLVVLCIYPTTLLGEGSQATLDSSQLPPMETFILGPIELESVSVWVPAARDGPKVNSSCNPQTNCLYSATLPACVDHTKTEFCPKELARLLAEYSAVHNEQSMPLTMHNGWQWEYSYSLCQFESGTYDLPPNSSWGCSWEAILTQTVGSADLQWIQICPSDNLVGKSGTTEQASSIEVTTFSSMRTRDGYPKRWQLKLP